MGGRPGQEAAEALPSTNGNFGVYNTAEGANSGGSCRHGALCLGKAMPVLSSHNDPTSCGQVEHIPEETQTPLFPLLSEACTSRYGP